MKVTEKDVQYVADLANLELTPEEQSRMVKDLNSILEHIDRLNQLDTKDVPPMAQVSDKFGIDPSKQGSERFGYVMREDEVRPCAASRGGDGECAGFRWSVLQGAEGD